MLESHLFLRYMTIVSCFPCKKPAPTILRTYFGNMSCWAAFVSRSAQTTQPTSNKAPCANPACEAKMCPLVERNLSALQLSFQNESNAQFDEKIRKWLNDNASEGTCKPFDRMKSRVVSGLRSLFQPHQEDPCVDIYNLHRLRNCVSNNSGFSDFG